MWNLDYLRLTAEKSLVGMLSQAEQKMRNVDGGWKGLCVSEPDAQTACVDFGAA
jgi:hypothetical protein